MKNIENNYLNNIYVEFKLLNNFLNLLNTKIDDNINDNYTNIFDKCIENLNDINIKHIDDEQINEKYIEYFIQNFVLNIKTFLRNNYDKIDNNIEKLKTKNKILIDKLKSSIENAENQENYIDELEKKLELEIKKNNNVTNIFDKINYLTIENEKLLNINKELKENITNQKEENNKIKKELKKYIMLYEKNKEYEKKYLKSNILNKKTRNLNELNIQSKKKNLHKRSYSLNYINNIEENMLSNISSNNLKLMNKNEYFVTDLSDNINYENNKSYKKILKKKYIYIENKIDSSDIKNVYKNKKLEKKKNKLQKYNTNYFDKICEQNNENNYKNNLSIGKINSSISSNNDYTDNDNNMYDKINILKKKNTNKLTQSKIFLYPKYNKMKTTPPYSNMYYHTLQNLHTDMQITYKESKNNTLISNIKKYIDKNCDNKLDMNFKKLKLINQYKMIIEDYHSLIYNFYEAIKNDLKIFIKNNNTIKINFTSDYSNKILNELNDEITIIKKTKIDKITRKLLRQIDTYRTFEKNNDNEQKNIKQSKPNEKSFLIHYNTFDNGYFKKIIKKRNKYVDSINIDKSFSYDEYETNDFKIIDRFKELKSNIHFYKFYEYIGLSKKQ